MSDDAPKRKKNAWLRRLSHAITGEPDSRDDLIQVLRDAESRQLLNTETLSMMEGVMQVSEMKVRDIMIPRSQMIIIESDQTLDEILPIIIKSGHSRFPVIGDNRDKIIGVLLAKDLLRSYFREDHSTFDITTILRNTSFVPESKRLNILLKEFKAQHNHLAIVANEYGNIAGLITIEDVLEQIVGDIEDEFDTDEDASSIREVAYNEFHINALISIEDFNEYFKDHLSTDESDTIGGLILQQLGHLPKRGETVQINQYHFEVLSADNRRIKLLKLRIKAPAAKSQ
jgi:magnesium and cobalt transporter